MKKTIISIIKAATFSGFVLGLSLSVAGKSAMPSTPLIQTHIGSLTGYKDNGIHVFKGIPYAEAPQGDLRWKPPVSKQAWTDILKARDFGAACPQPGAPVPNIYSQNLAPYSEDCLSLNIWAPENAKDAPVFVWIHGGSLRNGGSKESLYDGFKMAARGNIFVSFNYRLGVLGYMAHPELSAESAQNISGNYGLLDQIEALRWINKNIQAFGGNTNNITIAGESSGALSVMYLMASPQAQGLFSKAVAQSAYMVTSPELKRKVFGQPSAEAWGVYLAKKLKAKNLAALRKMDARKLITGAVWAKFNPLGIVDGHILPDQLVNIFAGGKQAAVPILAGFNSGEIRSLRVLAPKRPAKPRTYEAKIRERYLDLADEFLRLYPATNMQESIYAATRDALYGWTSERLVKEQTALGQPAFLYLFDHGYPKADKAGLHAFHASELPYVLGNLNRTPRLWPKIPRKAVEVDLSNAMLDYWSSFASAGTPFTTNGPAWLAYGKGENFMLFGSKPEPSTELMPGMFELHDEAVCRRRAGGAHPWHWNVGIVSPVLTKDNVNCP